MLQRTARRLIWRLGRKMYCFARGEGANRMEVNGEAYVQRCVLGAKHAAAKVTVFDVGANLGEWTRSFIKQRKHASSQAAEVWAFEPTPESFSKVSERFTKDFDVHCVRITLSDTVGRDRLLMDGETGGTNTLVFDNAMEEQAFGIADVEKTTADDYCALHGISHIHLFKCDTEGHDLSVIRGAKLLLSGERIDVLQFEYNSRWVYARAVLKDVFDVIAGSPYTLAAMRASRIELLRTWHPELERFFETNYLIVHSRAFSWFNVLDGHFDVSNTYA